MDHKRFTRTIIALTAGALALPIAGARAQDLAAVAGFQDLPGIEIEAAGLAPQDAATLGSAYTVITSEDLQQRQIRHAADALRSVPGVEIGQSGGVGGLTQVRIRGAEANQTAVYIDGVEVNSLSAGEFDFSTLLAADIERIEVLRGPQSGVYGANAAAGVINIITKKGKRVPSVSARVEAGSFGTKGISANASGAGEQGYLSVSAARRETEGFNLARSGSEADGSVQKTLFARAGFAPTDYFRIDAMGRFQSNDAEIDADTDYDGLLDDVSGETSLHEQTLGRISAQLDLFDKHWSQKIFADHLRDDSSFFSKIYGTSANYGKRAHYGYQSTVSFDTGGIVAASHKLIGLVEQKNESFESASAFGGGSASRSETGYAAEYHGAFADRLFLTGNIRYDDKSGFDDALTYRITGAYLLPPYHTRFHASLGRGIKDPDFFQQFGFALNFHGNPDLTPEKSVGWDLGVERKFWNDRLSLDVTYFHADLTDKIEGYGDTVVNVDGKSRRQGVEVQATLVPIEGLSISASYTYTDTKNPDGLEELRRPPHAASLNANYRFAGGRGQVGLGITYNGEMEDVIYSYPNYPRVTLSDYWLVKLDASYKLTDQFEIFGRVENLLDQDYEEVYGYSSAPIGAFAGLRLTLGAPEAPIEQMK